MPKIPKKGLLHRYVMNVQNPRQWVDHIDSDKLNNQSSNLRLATFRQNNLNRPKSVGTSSEYKGVTRKRGATKFFARVVHDGQTVCLGEYVTELAAARQVDFYIIKNNLDNTINGVDIPADFEPFQKRTRREFEILPSGSFRVNVNIDGNINSKVCRSREEALIVRAQLQAKAARSDYLRRLAAYAIDGSTATLRLSDGTSVLIDTCDVQQAAKYHWSMNHAGYARTGAAGDYQQLHRFLMRPKDHEIVDHINNIKTDNRHCNLRITTAAVNAHNRSLKNKGIQQLKSGRFFGLIQFRGKNHYCGAFDTFEEAVAARNAKAIEFYGEDARLQ